MFLLDGASVPELASLGQVWALDFSKEEDTWGHGD